MEHDLVFLTIFLDSKGLQFINSVVDIEAKFMPLKGRVPIKVQNEPKPQAQVFYGDLKEKRT